MCESSGVNVNGTPPFQHCGHVSVSSMACNVGLGLEIESWHDCSEVQSGLAADKDREWGDCYLC